MRFNTPWSGGNESIIGNPDAYNIPDFYCPSYILLGDYGDCVIEYYYFN